jgi:hypothetical protein
MLSGPILRVDVDRLRDYIEEVRGVVAVEHQLEIHEQAENVPALQGGTLRKGERIEFMQTSWSPAARLLAGVAGIALMHYGMRRRGLSGAALGALGSGLLARGLTPSLTAQVRCRMSSPSTR